MSPLVKTTSSDAYPNHLKSDPPAVCKINVIYSNNNMTQPEIGPILVPSANAEVTWSREEKAGADIVLYWNSWTYRPKHLHRNPDALRVLYMYESVVVDPLVYSGKLWEKFDHILTWNHHLAESCRRFHWFPLVYHDLPFSHGYGVTEESEVDEASLLQRPRAISQICGDKYSLIPSELYSLRRHVADWFAAHGTLPMYVYGIPGMKSPNYVGPSADKHASLSQYRYSLCFENSYHPTWSQGWTTEKIFDCMAAHTVPVYYGDSQIEKRVPPNCFIDYRQFDSLADLDRYLAELSDEDYLDFVRHARAFLAEHDPRKRYSCNRLYEKLVEIKTGNPPSLDVGNTLPSDYYASMTSLNERLRYVGMWVALKYYRFVYPVFFVLRWFRWLTKRLTLQSSKKTT